METAVSTFDSSLIEELLLANGEKLDVIISLLEHTYGGFLLVLGLAAVVFVCILLYRFMRIFF